MTAAESRPIFLENYNVFDALSKWALSGPKEDGRHWFVSGCGKVFSCKLAWQIGDQIASIHKAAPNAEYAVLKALREFEKNSGATT